MTIRQGLESLKVIAAALGGTLEQAADFCDRWRALHGQAPTVDDTLAEAAKTAPELATLPTPPGKAH